ncbi:MAG TPA: endonuclease, partial [Bacteroidales bacterium]|nr:endonuclease [Bacteroidales bacterium]
RGIDVAFAFKKGSFTYLGHEKIPVTFADDAKFLTRDILHIWGTAGKKDTLHFFVNHWSSRRSGNDESEPKRVGAALILKQATEKILAKSPEAKIIIMGDMNDEPKNKSLTETLGAANPETGAKSALYNLMYPDDELNNGTYLFRGDWNMLDNMVVSTGLLNAKKGFKSAAKGIIHKPEFLNFTNNKGEKSPNRTYGGDNYYGGYSDHYPIYLKLTK